MRTPPAPALLLALSLIGCGAPPGGGDAPGDDPEGGAPGFATSPPPLELVGPGTVSSALPEFAAALSASGDTLWFNRTSPDRSTIELFWAFRQGNGWTEPTRFPPTEGTAAWDPFVEPGGHRLWVTADRPRPDGTAGDLDLWYLDRTADGWSEPRFAPPPLNSDSAEVFTSATRDGLLFFSSYRGDGDRRTWSARPGREGGWVEPEALELGVGPEASNPAVAPDGSFLVLSVPVDGVPDLAVWCRTATGWARGAPLPEPVSTRWAEFAPAVVGDELWFTSERPGVVGPQPDSVRPPGDLYRTDAAVARAACAEAGAGAE